MARAAGEPMTAGGKGEGERTALIRSDIARTRGEMSRTVNEIEERLSPANIKEQAASVYEDVKVRVKDDLGRELRDAKHMVSEEITHARTAVRDATVGRVENMVHDARETVTDAGATVLDTIKSNPIPTALIGLGLGWLIFGAKRTSSEERSMRRYRREAGGRYGYAYAEGRDERADFAGRPRRRMRQGERAVGEGTSNVGHRVQEGASQLVEGAQDMAHNVGETVSNLAHDAGHRVDQIAGGARNKARHLAGDAQRTGRRVLRDAERGVRRAERTLEDTFRENPLAIGAVALAIGAAIGLSLPHTRVEDEWMGEAKDRLLDKAEGAAGDAIHKAEEKVGQLTGTAENVEKKGGDGERQEPKNGLSKSQPV